jgi:sugar/nucleoside kinase (ribokinase family)
MAAMADLGSKVAYIGRVKDDQLGKVFSHDIRAVGVRFDNEPAAVGPSTARSLIFVTPDAQRTMQTYLGACVELTPNDVDERLIASSATVYLEGYLWDRPEAKAACLKAAEIARRHGGKIALTLSDSFCVDRWRSEFLELIDQHVDIIFANDAELTSLYETEDLSAAIDAIAARTDIAAVTRSEKGSIIACGDTRHEIEAIPPDRLLDTTGAGDLYAAGFLHGLAHGYDLPKSGYLGSACASTIIAQYGARSERPLRSLIHA